MPERTAPGTSNRAGGPSRRAAGGPGSRSPRAATRIAATTAAWNRNAVRHPNALVSSPPSKGPAAAPTPPAALTTANARARSATSPNSTVTRT
nr:hypothetical protein GCM10017745_40740 [Saccharothrix mutabilis subsp. capreolus]